MENKLINELYNNQDLGYRDFSVKLITTKYEVIGVRLPVLKKMAKQIAKSEYINDICKLDTNIYEAIMVQGLTMAYAKKSISEKLFYFDAYVKKIDNWAICDSVATSIKNKEEDFYKKCLEWAKSKEEFIVRFGIINLMSHFMEEQYISNTIAVLLKIKKSDYYIEMAIAWYIQRLYFYDKVKAEEMLNNEKLSGSIKKKAMQKIRDSKRERKTYKEI